MLSLSIISCFFGHVVYHYSHVTISMSELLLELASNDPCRQWSYRHTSSQCFHSVIPACARSCGDNASTVHILYAMPAIHDIEALWFLLLLRMTFAGSGQTGQPPLNVFIQLSLLAQEAVGTMLWLSGFSFWCPLPLLLAPCSFPLLHYHSLPVNSNIQLTLNHHRCYSH